MRPLPLKATIRNPTVDSKNQRDAEQSAKLGPGAYGILFEISQPLSVPTGRLDVGPCAAGWYAYIGSAMGGISGRLKHHLGDHRARPRWHIDYLLPRGELSAVVVAETLRRVECSLAAFLARRFHVVPRFGSSDCRCVGHLFWSEVRSALLDSMLEAVREAGCSPLEIAGPFSNDTLSRPNARSGTP